MMLSFTLISRLYINGLQRLSHFPWLAQVPSDSSLQPGILKTITTFQVINGVLSLVIAYALLKIVQVSTDWLSEQVPRRFRLVVKQSIPFVKGLIIIVVVSHLVSLFIDISARNVLALTSAVAVALGFAFKDLVSSIIAGIMALFEMTYRIGDRVQIGEHYGEVIGYGLRGIRLQTPDDNIVNIPHSKNWTEAISNANSGQLEAQVLTDFYLNHDVEVGLVTQILYQVAYTSKYTQLRLPVAVQMEETLWGTHFKLRAYPMDARDEFAYKTDLIRRAKQVFAKCDIAYPKLAVEDSLK
ncbi:MAG: mechanosensitive ion channel family protein [Symploca sp. SIO3E6]|nr:mechanosensitive ion channel family protein [Caldora sp. SIO3E6]